MGETFFIGDTHFGHKNIIVFEGTKNLRPFSTIEEHDEEIIRRWNSVVRQHDIVWHLGDVAFGRHSLELVKRLNGAKRLIAGNHDGYQTQKYLDAGFLSVRGAWAVDGFLLTHVPVHPGQLEREGFNKGNIHGHLHMNHVMKEIVDCSYQTIQHVRDPRYINVSCEQINLTPVSLAELNKRVGQDLPNKE